MYWVVKDDGGYEVPDGQRCTISISQYVHGDDRFFFNLTTDEQEQIPEARSLRTTKRYLSCVRPAFRT